MGRKFSLFVTAQFVILACLVLVGFMLVHETHLLHSSVRTLEHVSKNYGNAEGAVISQKRDENVHSVDSADFNKTQDRARPDERRGQRSAANGVIIFTTMRAGSSFVGELFNRHGQVFYSFEPLHAFGSRPAHAPGRLQALSDVMSCDFAHLADLYHKINVSGEIVEDRSARCAHDNFCFKQKSLFLRRNSSLCSPKCKVPFDPEELTRLCRSSRLSVAKIITELDLGQVQKVMEDNTKDIRVIHLVRDPRAILASRREVFTSYDSTKSYSVVKQSKYICPHMEKNLRRGACFGSNNTFCSDFANLRNLRQKYLLVRFEDVSLNPLKEAKRIYDFVGIDFDPAVRKWIVENTRQSPEKHDLFGTGRDSMAAVARWRETLNFTEVAAIQGPCANAMRTLNYKNVFNETQLRNNSLNLWW